MRAPITIAEAALLLCEIGKYLGWGNVHLDNVTLETPAGTVPGRGGSAQLYFEEFAEQQSYKMTAGFFEDGSPVPRNFVQGNSLPPALRLEVNSFIRGHTERDFLVSMERHRDQGFLRRVFGEGLYTPRDKSGKDRFNHWRIYDSSAGFRSPYTHVSADWRWSRHCPSGIDAIGFQDFARGGNHLYYDRSMGGLVYSPGPFLTRAQSPVGIVGGRIVESSEVSAQLARGGLECHGSAIDELCQRTGSRPLLRILTGEAPVPIEGVDAAFGEVKKTFQMRVSSGVPKGGITSGRKSFSPRGGSFLAIGALTLILGAMTDLIIQTRSTVFVSTLQSPSPGFSAGPLQRDD
ncbi:MAG: hypothetical protein HYT76_08190 [Deltaproteobacteria bacterium]|nr:hypothetical protein [Deltaproteobacteria bacterium]